MFDLKTPGYAACALAINKTVFITIGGKGLGTSQLKTHGKVDRWCGQKVSKAHFFPRYDNRGNYLDSLPDLNIRRYGHACSLFQSKEEQVYVMTLKSALRFDQNLFTFCVNISHDMSLIITPLSPRYTEHVTP